jgi:hypothetical protein
LAAAKTGAHASYAVTAAGPAIMRLSWWVVHKAALFVTHVGRSPDAKMAQSACRRVVRWRNRPISLKGSRRVAGKRQKAHMFQ